MTLMVGYCTVSSRCCNGFRPFRNVWRKVGTFEEANYCLLAWYSSSAVVNLGGGSSGKSC